MKYVILLNDEETGKNDVQSSFDNVDDAIKAFNDFDVSELDENETIELAKHGVDGIAIGWEQNELTSLGLSKYEGSWVIRENPTERIK